MSFDLLDYNNSFAVQLHLTKNLPSEMGACCAQIEQQTPIEQTKPAKAYPVTGVSAKQMPDEEVKQVKAEPEAA